MSDQDDFFFDEDDTPAQKPADKAAPKGGAARKEAPAPRAKSAAAPASAGGQSVTMTVAALIGVVALLVGIIIGILVPTGGTQPTTPVTMPAVDPGQARPLAPEELGGDLPPGHPDIGEMGGGMGETGTVDPGAPADDTETE